MQVILGDIVLDCRVCTSKQGTQAMTPALVATLPAHPTWGEGQLARGRGQQVKGHPSGRGQNGGGQVRCYVFPGRPKVELSYAVCTGIISICHTDASILFDLIFT